MSFSPINISESSAASNFNSYNKRTKLASTLAITTLDVRFWV